MPTAIRIRQGEVRYETDDKMTPAERAEWIQANGGKGGVNSWGRSYADLAGNATVLAGGARRHWAFMGKDKLLLMASGGWNLTDVKGLMGRYALKEGGVKNDKLWFEIKDPSAFLVKDVEGALRLESNPCYQWLPKQKQWLVSLPLEDRAPRWDVHEGALALRCSYTREDILEARAKYKDLMKDHQMIMLGDQPVIRFLAIPRKQKDLIDSLSTRRDLTVVRNGVATERRMRFLDLAGKTYLYAEGKRKLTVGDQARWFDGVLVRVPADSIWHMIIREAPMRKTSDLESCSQCPFWATFEAETGREQRCAKGLVNNSIEAMRSLYCDDLVKMQDRGNQFRPFLTWVEATSEWRVDSQREGKIPTWLFAEQGLKWIAHAASPRRKSVTGLSMWGENRLSDEAQAVAASPDVLDWALALMGPRDLAVLARQKRTPQEWVAWLGQHGDELSVPFVAPSLYHRVVDLAGTDSIKSLGAALGSITAEMTDEEIVGVLEDTLEREVTLYHDPANEEPEEDETTEVVEELAA